jgi:hypothetical protein
LNSLHLSPPPSATPALPPTAPHLRLSLAAPWVSLPHRSASPPLDRVLPLPNPTPTCLARGGGGPHPCAHWLTTNEAVRERSVLGAARRRARRIGRWRRRWRHSSASSDRPHRSTGSSPPPSPPARQGTSALSAPTVGVLLLLGCQCNHNRATTSHRCPIQQPCAGRHRDRGGGGERHCRAMSLLLLHQLRSSPPHPSAEVIQV